MLTGPRGHHTAWDGKDVPSPASGRSDTSPATGSELDRRPPCSRDRTPPRLRPEEPARRGPFPTRPEKPHRSDGDRKKSSRGATGSPRGRGFLGQRQRSRAPTCVRAGHVPERPSLGAAEPPRRSLGPRRRRAACNLRDRSRSRGRERGVPPPARGPQDNGKRSSCHRPRRGPPAFARLAAIGFPPGKKAGGKGKPPHQKKN